MVKRKGPFYGWWILIARLVISFGWAASPFVVILVPLMEEFKTGRGAISNLSALSLLSGAFCGYFIAKVIDRHSPKKFTLWGSVLGGASFLLCAVTTDLWQMYVLFFAIGVGFTGFAGSIPTVILVNNWFVKKRGLAMGIAWAGNPIGTLIMTPIIGIIFTQLGWRATFLFAGIVTFVLTLPLIIFILKDKPQEMGLLPDGDTSLEPVIPNVVKPNAFEAAIKKQGLKIHLKSLPIWLICIGFSLMVMAEMAVIQHEVAFLTDMGITTVLAASALGFTAGFSGGGRLISGLLADRISPRYVTILLCLVEIIGIFFLMQARSMVLVWIFVVIWGIASGSFFSILPLVIRDTFPAGAFNTVFGAVNAITYVAMAAGIPLAGYIFDATGSYNLVFILVIGFYFIAMVSTYFAYGIRPRPFKNVLKKA